MLPWSFSEEAAVRNICRSCSTICGWWWHDRGPVGNHRRRQMGRDHNPADPLYQHLIVTAETKILALRRERRAPCPVRGRSAEAAYRGVRIVDMSTSNAWAEFADIFIRTRKAHSSSMRGPRPTSRA